MPIFVNGHLVPTFNFAGGECHVKIGPGAIQRRTELTAHLYTSNDIMSLLLTVDAVRRVNSLTSIDLTIPYFPYARQDRVCNPGESFSLKVMADLVNQLNCTSVTVYDPHSEVTTSLLHNCVVVSQADIVAQSPLAKHITDNGWLLVSPDAGAEKKIHTLVERLATKAHTPSVLCAKKTRESATGRITATEVKGDVRGKDMIIIDDICDGGRTFIELAKALKEGGARDIHLYVTHGIFSKGLDELKVYFKHIYSFQVMLQDALIDRSFLSVIGEKKQ